MTELGKRPVSPGTCPVCGETHLLVSKYGDHLPLYR